MSTTVFGQYPESGKSHSQEKKRRGIQYDLRCYLIWKSIKLLTILFHAGYTVLYLMPLGLEPWMENQFKKAREFQ